MNEVEFAVHFARIALDELDFLELRGWMAARLRPIGEPRRPPPERPR